MVLRVIRLRAGVRRLFALLDAEGVGIFQTIVYVHIVAAGIYGLFVASGVPQAVEDSMGPAVNAVWLWLCMGAALCLFGKWLMPRAANVGMWVQLTGDIFTGGALIAYVLATFNTSWWGKALFAVFIVASIAECVVLLVIRDVRRIVQVEMITRR